MREWDLLFTANMGLESTALSAPIRTRLISDHVGALVLLWSEKNQLRCKKITQDGSPLFLLQMGVLMSAEVSRFRDGSGTSYAGDRIDPGAVYALNLSALRWSSKIASECAALRRNIRQDSLTGCIALVV